VRSLYVTAHWHGQLPLIWHRLSTTRQQSFLWFPFCNIAGTLNSSPKGTWDRSTTDRNYTIPAQQRQMFVFQSSEPLISLAHLLAQSTNPLHASHLCNNLVLFLSVLSRIYLLFLYSNWWGAQIPNEYHLLMSTCSIWGVLSMKTCISDSNQQFASGCYS